MNTSRTLNRFFFIAAPLIVAISGLSILAALCLVGVLLMWHWLLIVASMSRPPGGPELILDTISASHFVEKVRWCMDRLGLDYLENPSGGALGAFFVGRTVPRLRFKTGMVESSIGNSPEILRYLWGRYQVSRGNAAEFLRANPARLDLEQRIDRCGRDLQVWVYYHLLPNRQLTLQAWGANNPAIPAWQRWLLRLLFPLQRVLIRRAFQITTDRYHKAIQHLDELLAYSESLLADQRTSLLGGHELNYTDISFAAINGLWLWPAAYGGGQADAVRLPDSHRPEAMLADVQSWSNRFPLSRRFIEQTYDQRSLTEARPGNI